MPLKLVRGPEDGVHLFQDGGWSGTWLYGTFLLASKFAAHLSKRVLHEVACEVDGRRKLCLCVRYLLWRTISIVDGLRQSEFLKIKSLMLRMVYAVAW